MWAGAGRSDYSQNGKLDRVVFLRKGKGRLCNLLEFKSSWSLMIAWNYSSNSKSHFECRDCESLGQNRFIFHVVKHMCH